MRFAWHAHLKELNGKPWLIAPLVSRGIALFEYLLQETITLSVCYLKQPAKQDAMWAGLSMVGEVYSCSEARGAEPAVAIHGTSRE
ncbi:DMT family protein [Zoogloeaceae bacterium G21618-S1]|nr:DMT family protein [Zoogloeaceae bacterium G21618-S1]